METNIVIRGEEKLKAFLDENATIDLETAKCDLERQFLADEKAHRYILSADKSKDGKEHAIPCMGISMDYDAQGTQIGGGKAYLDKGQEVERRDITIAFI